MTKTSAASRLDTVRAAFDEYVKPAPLPKGLPQRPMSQLELAGELVRRERPAVGGMTKLLGALPAGDRQRVVTVANLYAHERELGRHGNPQDVAEIFEVPKDIAEAVVDALEVDYVAAELGRRRSDADLPLPELTRRDEISAALDVHNATFKDI
ncbi:MAG: hypothetical protein JNL87_23015 [Burkholderiaceae bacterium]|nr:hypothetical protein [Burkholderiaceae bacterium]